MKLQEQDFGMRAQASRRYMLCRPDSMVCYWWVNSLHINQSSKPITSGYGMHSIIMRTLLMTPSIATGITWYAQWHGWNFWLAFFYQVQACFSVGYR